MIVADIICVGKFLERQQFAPLFPAHDTKTLAVVGNIAVAEGLERLQDFIDRHADIAVNDDVCGGRCQRIDDQLIGLAAQRIGTGIGDDLTLVDIDLEFLNTINPVAGVIIGECDFDVGMIEIHHRHHAVGGFCGR